MRLFHAFSFLHLPKWIAAVVLAILLCPFATQAEEIEKSAKTELKDSGFQFELPVRLKAADKGIDDLWLERYQVYQSSEKVTELEAKHAKLQKRRNKFLRPVGDVEIAKQSFSDWINSFGKKTFRCRHHVRHVPRVRLARSPKMKFRYDAKAFAFCST